MASEPTESAGNLLAQIRTPGTLMLDCSVLKKGNDNYHVDIQLSKRFIGATREVIQGMSKRALSGRRPAATSEDAEEFREAYVEIVEDSLHRTKTDLTPAEVCVLHFGVVKFVIAEIRASLDAVVQDLEETLAQQQYAGSRSLLVTQQKFAWVRQHYASFQFRITRAMLRLLQREENNQLRTLREQFLGDAMMELPHVLLNPLLAGPPRDALLLMENYALWADSGKRFSSANEKLEALLRKRLSQLDIVSLKPPGKSEGATEVYDEFGGLFSIQEMLGPAVDQKESVSEEFSWLDHPGNFRLLFDASVHERMRAQQEGRRAQWKFRSGARKLEKIGVEAIRALASDAEAKIMIAGYVLREEWLPAWDDILDVASACAYVAGQDDKRILARIDQSKEGALLMIKKLDELSKKAARVYKEDMDEIRVRILTDVSRYRLHLKYFRFAHRIFNRISVLTEPEEIHLSRANGRLYQLTGREEDEDDVLHEPQIIHHAVLKADVRGSTTVTQELIRQNLNPASYFSTRFFGPINDLLSVYGAEKIFIEGDAIILGIHEYDQSPEDWYSVSRICGIAKEILDIVSSKNAHSKSTGLPLLELGIGICYEDDRPLFLFDEDKPIMISPAIGEADRMSSCSWRLREAFAEAPFHVQVLNMSEDDSSRGEKGQTQVRYNLNGILMANDAFIKLKSEIQLKKVSIKVVDRSETMYVGRFPDVRGKERELVIREGIVGRWDGEQSTPGPEDGERYYEVLPNSKLASQVLEVVRSQ